MSFDSLFFMFRINGMSWCHGWQRMTMFRPFLAIHGFTALVHLGNCSMHYSNNLHPCKNMHVDERSVFLFQTKTKYLHPCKQCHGAMTVFRHPAFTALIHPCMSMAKNDDVQRFFKHPIYQIYF